MYCNFYDITKYRKSHSNENILVQKNALAKYLANIMLLFPRTKSRIRQEPSVGRFLPKSANEIMTSQPSWASFYKIKISINAKSH